MSPETRDEMFTAFAELLRDLRDTRNQTDPPQKDGRRWEGWMLTVCGGLGVAGIIGCVVMYGQVTRMSANQENQNVVLVTQQNMLQHQQSQIDQIQGQINVILQELRRQ